MKLACPMSALGRKNQEASDSDLVHAKPRSMRKADQSFAVLQTDIPAKNRKAGNFAIFAPLREIIE
jgi:hypothetical protein